MTTETKKELSKNQKAFVRAAEKQGYEVDYGYSGRGMYGETCPAIRAGSALEFRRPKSASLSMDSMGRGLVIYASH